MNGRAPPTREGGEVVVYEVTDGGVRADVRFDRETVWLTQQQMAELFGRDSSVVTRHVRNAFHEGEPDPEAISAKFALVRSEGGRLSRQVTLRHLVSATGRSHAGPKIHPEDNRLTERSSRRWCKALETNHG